MLAPFVIVNGSIQQKKAVVDKPRLRQKKPRATGYAACPRPRFQRHAINGQTAAGSRNE